MTAIGKPRNRMTRAAARAIFWLAANDETVLSAMTDVDEVAGLTTTLLAADVFDWSPRALAAAVIVERRKMQGMTAEVAP